MVEGVTKDILRISVLQNEYYDGIVLSAVQFITRIPCGYSPMTSYLPHEPIIVLQGYLDYQIERNVPPG